MDIGHNNKLSRARIETSHAVGYQILLSQDYKVYDKSLWWAKIYVPSLMVL